MRVLGNLSVWSNLARSSGATAQRRWQTVPATMKAMVLPSPGPASALELREVEVVPPRPGDVLVKVDACAVAYRDTLDRRGAFPFIQPDAVLGHEMAGTVVAVGSGAESGGLQEGDRVVSVHWDQNEAWPAPLTPSGPVSSFLGLTHPGGYAEFCTAPAGCFVQIPHGWSGSQIHAAPVMSTFGTVWQGAVVRAGLKAGETVLVTGASGGVGSAAVQLCRRIGCKVIAVTSSPSKREFVEGLGADVVVVSESGPKGMDFNRAQQVKDNPPAVVIECTGGPGFQASLRSLRPEGRLVLVGNVDNSFGQLPLGLCILNSLSVVGSDSISAKALQELFQFLDRGANRQLCAGSEKGQEPLWPKIQSTLPLESVAEAHSLLENRGVSGRIVLDMSL